MVPDLVNVHRRTVAAVDTEKRGDDGLVSVGIEVSGGDEVRRPR